MATPTPQQVLTELDAAALAVREQTDALGALTAIGAAMDRLIGSRMLTFLHFDLPRFDMVRLYCTLPERYAIGAHKQMRRGRWYDCLVERGMPFIASGDDEMRATFGDHAELAAIGVTSTLCTPVRYLGRTLGTMNLNGAAGRYGEREAQLAQPFATLAAPIFLAHKT